MKNLKGIFSIDFVVMAGLTAWLFIQLSRAGQLPKEYWIKQIVENCLFGVLYFVNIYIFYPKLYRKLLGIPYLLTLVGAVFATVWLNRLFSFLINMDGAFARYFDSIGSKYRPGTHWTTTWIVFLSVIVLALSYVSIVAKRLQRNQLAFEISEKERVSAELAFLKAQINPHFFFNTLHTIYALMDSNPSSAKASIYSLSHMMRYVLYETKNEKTSLNKEIEFISDYISLMKVRIAGDVQIILNTPPGLRDVPIAPMLLLPFVENAFKHGVSAVHPSYVYIEMSENNGKLVFEVRNSLFAGLAKQLDEDNGIGITNTRRRLDLIYPGKYSLNVEKDEFAKEYVITLTLDLNEY